MTVIESAGTWIILPIKRYHLMTEQSAAVTDHIYTRGQGSVTCDPLLCTFTDPWPYYISLDEFDVGVHN